MGSFNMENKLERQMSEVPIGHNVRESVWM